CQFGYRDSIFKQGAKDRYIITSVNLKLTKRDHRLHTTYGAIEGELRERGIVYPDIRDVSDAVIAIRKQKLPDPKELGNSGSFFKNPMIPKKKFEKLQKEYPKDPFIEMERDNYKISPDWLIDYSSFKCQR